jgi:EAL domain-containing protein (putative c-di-GMP-specific phosphodiesterase class I)
MSKAPVGEERAKTLENDLAGAWARGEMDIRYQPEFSIGEDRLVRFEALARWCHPTLGAIPPSTFIPIAEKSGLIVPLGLWVLENACYRTAAWQKSGFSIGIAVNVSVVQFSVDDFVSRVVDTVGRTGIEPALLQLELTESTLLPGVEETLTKMNELRSMRIELAIDDFGTGYSSASYLRMFPFTTLKIDRSFVQELTGNGYSGHLIEPIAALGHQFGMTVVIEGIETARQLQAVQESGCDEVQGYLLGKATSSPDVTQTSASVIENCNRRRIW